MAVQGATLSSVLAKIFHVGKLIKEQKIEQFCL